MKIENYKRINGDDFAEKDRDVANKIADTMNVFCDQVQQALGNGLNITDNFQLTIQSFTVTVDSTGVPTSKTAFKTNLPAGCGGLTVILAINNTRAVGYPTSSPFINFTESPQGVLNINNITGLITNNQYTLKVFLFPA